MFKEMKKVMVRALPALLLVVAMLTAPMAQARPAQEIEISPFVSAFNWVQDAYQRALGGIVQTWTAHFGNTETDPAGDPPAEEDGEDPDPPVVDDDDDDDGNLGPHSDPFG